jgi:multicomponent Na+:H+ antiporter subunit D
MSDLTPHPSLIPFWAIAVSLAAVPLILVSSRRPNVREFWTLAAGVLKFGFVLVLLADVRSGRQPECGLIEIAPGIELALRVDAFGLFFALVASGLWILTSIYSIGYMRGHGEQKQTRYFACFALSLSATIGIAFAANLLTFVIFYEMLTLATYPLVVHKESARAIRAGRQYLAYSLTAGVLLIAASAWVHTATGTLDFEAGGIEGLGALTPEGVKLLFCLFLAGVGVKAGIMPLHSWLPNAMVAPTPVSALLHAVAVVKSGVFGVVRVAGFVFGPELMQREGLNLILAVPAGATILLASLIALRQDELKRRLAYSTVGQLSYIALGVALLSPEGFAGGVFHISTHALMKITLFFCAGAIYVATHKTEISDLDGLGRRMPFTFVAFLIGSLSIIGLPPFGGAWTKWYLGLAAIDSGHAFVIGVLIVSSLLNVAYLLSIVGRAFFLPAPGQDGSRAVAIKEAPLACVVPLSVTAFLCLVLFFQIDKVHDLVAVALPGN